MDISHSSQDKMDIVHSAPHVDTKMDIVLSAPDSLVQNNVDINTAPAAQMNSRQSTAKIANTWLSASPKMINETPVSTAAQTATKVYEGPATPVASYTDPQDFIAGSQTLWDFDTEEVPDRGSLSSGPPPHPDFNRNRADIVPPPQRVANSMDSQRANSHGQSNTTDSPTFTATDNTCLITTDESWVKIYDVVRASGLPNYQGCRIPLSHSLNMGLWRHLLKDYNDAIVCDFLEFGWPIGYTLDSWPADYMDNHASAKAHPEHVDYYLQTEKRHGVLLGPFQSHPFRWTHTSPLMTRPKRNSDHRRVIVDLSFPPGQSVNQGIPADTYLGEEYKLCYPTVDDLAGLILARGQGCLLYKLDISRAYRQLRSDPLDWPLLGLHWPSADGAFWIDTAIPFGLRTGAMFCMRTTNAVKYMMQQLGPFDIVNYVDDLAGCEDPETALTACNTLRSLLAELGLPEAADKLWLPATVMEFIGILFNTETLTMSIPEDKLQETLAELRRWHTKTRATRSDLQHILGKLHHIAKCAKPARLFVGRMLETLRRCPASGPVPLDVGFKKDIAWFLNFVAQYNGKAMMYHPPAVEDGLEVELDACLTGIGGLCAGEMYHAELPDWIQQPEHHISHTEMINIVVACKLWKDRWQHRTVTAFCDNIACVHVLQTGRGRDPFLLQCAREIWMISATHDFTLLPLHRPGQDNIAADCLSRWHLGQAYQDKFWQHIGSQQITPVEVDSRLFKLTEDI